MAVPVYNPTLSPYDLIYLTVEGLTTYTENGGSDVDSYFVEMSIDSTDVWTVIQGDEGSYTLNLALETSGHTLGNTVNFRAKAHNIHGWGELSEPLTVVASTMPDQPEPPVISIEDLNVKISWSAPNNNYAQISSYIIKIANEAKDSFEEQTTYCDGSDIMVN